MTPQERADAVAALLDLAIEYAPTSMVDRVAMLAIAAGIAFADSAWPAEPSPELRDKLRDTVMAACYTRRQQLATLLAECKGEA